jgi:hypothetical protein
MRIKREGIVSSSIDAVYSAGAMLWSAILWGTLRASTATSEDSDAHIPANRIPLNDALDSHL